MDKNRMWIMGSVIVMVAVVALGLLLGIQPQLAAVATANDARAAVEASNAGQALVLTKLKSDFAGIDALKAELVPLQASVPSGTDMPRFVTQLGTLAGSTSVTLSGMTVANAVPYAAPAALASTGTTDAATGTPAAATPLTNAQITATTFASLAVQITVTGSYAHALDFISGLQSGQRLYLVTGITTAPTAAAATEGATAGSTGDVTATITGLVYVLVPPATTPTPAPTATATPAATPTATPAAK
jgi:Tfp pilus assembly protein PilO